jgi:hypothetical protein
MQLVVMERQLGMILSVVFFECVYNYFEEE